MKAHVIVAEMDPSRIDVARRAVTHEVIPSFRAQPGSGRGHWMVNRTTGELLVLTTWDDDAAMTAGLAADRTHRANLTERTGLGIRATHTMEVLGSTQVDLTGTPAARWVCATWVRGPAAEPPNRLVDEPAAAFCGRYWLGDPASGAGLALTFWSGPAPRDPAHGPTVERVAVYESIGTAGERR